MLDIEMDAGKKIKGYATHETRAVCLWLEKDEESQAYWTKAAKQAREEAAGCWQVRVKIWEPLRAPIYLLANRLEEEVTEWMPESDPGLYSDLLNLAFLKVDWHEVAEAFLEAEFWSQPF